MQLLAHLNHEPAATRGHNNVNCLNHHISNMQSTEIGVTSCTICTTCMPKILWCYSYVMFTKCCNKSSLSRYGFFLTVMLTKMKPNPSNNWGVRHQYDASFTFIYLWKKNKQLTTPGESNSNESWIGWAEDSEGRWNSKCAIERSIGFVSVSISIKLVQ